MGARTGRQFLEGLRDGREVWVDGEKVKDVTTHPSLSGAANTLAESKPRMALCLYHRADDAQVIPKLVAELNPEYESSIRS